MFPARRKPGAIIMSNYMIENLSQKTELPCSVIIIAGFLGSGKTTLLKHLLEWEINQGRRPYVIIKGCLRDRLHF